MYAPHVYWKWGRIRMLHRKAFCVSHNLSKRRIIQMDIRSHCQFTVISIKISHFLFVSGWGKNTLLIKLGTPGNKITRREEKPTQLNCLEVSKCHSGQSLIFFETRTFFDGVFFIFLIHWVFSFKPPNILIREHLNTKVASSGRVTSEIHLFTL